MIQGNYYTEADLSIPLLTELDLSAAISVGFRAAFADGRVIDYTGTVENLDTIRALIPSADNTQAGRIELRAWAVLTGGKTFGDPEEIFILAVPALNP